MNKKYNFVIFTFFGMIIKTLKKLLVHEKYAGLIFLKVVDKYITFERSR